MQAAQGPREQTTAFAGLRRRRPSPMQSIAFISRIRFVQIVVRLPVKGQIVAASVVSKAQESINGVLFAEVR